MAFGRKKDEAGAGEQDVMSDPTGWLLESGIAEVLIMKTAEIKYMCMLFYTFFHGKLGHEDSEGHHGLPLHAQRTPFNDTQRKDIF